MQIATSMPTRREKHDGIGLEGNCFLHQLWLNYLTFASIIKFLALWTYCIAESILESWKWSMQMKVKIKVTQSCPTRCDTMDYSPPGSSVHEISQARILERVAMPFSRGSTQGLNPGLLHCRQILYRLSHQGSPGTRRKFKAQYESQNER